MADRAAREEAIQQAATLVRSGPVWVRPANRGTQNSEPLSPVAMSTYSLSADETVRLEQLVTAVNETHRHVLAKGREVIENAIYCGEALMEARSLVEKGGWLDWMRDRIAVHPTTAYRYMRLAEHKDRVLASSVESIEAAVRELADLPRRGYGPRGYCEADKEQWLRLVEQFGIKPTARALGISPSTIWKWTSDRSPDRGRASRPRLGAVGEITDGMIEATAGWLSARYRLPHDDAVRADALELIGIVIAAHDAVAA